MGLLWGSGGSWREVCGGDGPFRGSLGVAYGRVVMPGGVTGACGVGAGDSRKQSPGMQSCRLEAAGAARGRGPGPGFWWGPGVCVWTAAV